eukprot:gene26157-34770_t
MAVQTYFVPLSFGLVETGFYRSSYPATKSFPFIERLQLKTMICFSPGDIKSELRTFANEHNIKIVEIDLKQNQEPFLSMSEAAIHSVMDILQDNTSRPILAFCTNGKVKTSTAVACYRKYLGWGMSSLIQEYERFCDPDTNVVDIAFVDNLTIIRNG